MRIEFDPAKDAANRVKHGVSLAVATEMVFSRATVVEDIRRDYGERRFNAYGTIDGRLHVLCFTWRGTTIRAIGLRKANAQERKLYDRSTP